MEQKSFTVKNYAELKRCQVSVDTLRKFYHDTYIAYLDNYKVEDFSIHAIRTYRIYTSMIGHPLLTKHENEKVDEILRGHKDLRRSFHRDVRYNRIMWKKYDKANHKLQAMLRCVTDDEEFEVLVTTNTNKSNSSNAPKVVVDETVFNEMKKQYETAV